MESEKNAPKILNLIGTKVYEELIIEFTNHDLLYSTLSTILLMVSDQLTHIGESEESLLLLSNNSLLILQDRIAKNTRLFLTDKTKAIKELPDFNFLEGLGF